MLKPRRKTPVVKIGTINMGSEFPIVVQSMTNTPTADVAATVAQIKELADAGSELVRMHHKPMQRLNLKQTGKTRANT